MNSTVKVAADRAYDETKSVLPAEMVRGVYMQNAPSLRALKLMHLMIATAGGRMAEDVRHDIRLSDIRKIDGMAHHDQESLKPLFAELRSATMIYDEPERQRWSIGGLLDHGTVDYRHELSGDTLVSWYFGRMFRNMAAESNHWAILDRQTVFHLGSKYSVLLFQHIASLTNLNYVTSKTFTIPELRAMLGVTEGKLARFANLNARAIQPAIAEINQLSRMTLTATPRKIGRTVACVEIAWEVKSDPTETKREMARPKHGRKSRRNGTAETPAPAFPDSGGIHYAEPWQSIAKSHGNGKDINLIANDFRTWAKGKFALDSKGVEKKFEAFCKGVKL